MLYGMKLKKVNFPQKYKFFYKKEGFRKIYKNIVSNVSYNYNYDYNYMELSFKEVLL